MREVECPVCGKRTLALRTGAGRHMKHRNMEVTLPDDVAVPECRTCGARPIDYRLAKKLDAVLERLWQQQLAITLAKDLEVLSEDRPLYQWEQLLGLSVGYLSKLKKAKRPSAQLVALVRLLANQPERRRELERLWARGPRRGGVHG